MQLVLLDLESVLYRSVRYFVDVAYSLLCALIAVVYQVVPLVH